MLFLNKSEILTKVVDCYTHNNDIYVILVDTIFYPQSGGQNCDKGKIANADVLDVFYYEDKIVHKISKEVFGEVHCILDDSVRYNNSMLHTAQHLFSAIVESDKIITNSFSMKANSFSIDVHSPLTKQELNTYENKINSAIRSGAKIIVRNYDSNLDSELDISYLNVEAKDVRLVIIDGYDKNPCGGTHLKDISELSYFKIVKYKYNNDVVRITAIVGFDAINYTNKCFDDFQTIVKILNQQESDVVGYIENKLKENKKLQKQVKKLEKQVRNV